MGAPPDPGEVQRIAAIADGAARNRRITDAYFALSTELHRRLPGGANWCTFATWASRQAGVTIRHEDLLESLRVRLRRAPAVVDLLDRVRALVRREQSDLVDLLVGHVAALGPLRRSGEAVARGNVKVFAEIGLTFARWLERFPVPDASAEPELAAFLTAALRDGAPPDGQAMLRDAFRAYHRAARATVPQDRAQWLLLANLRIGYHEQVRLQPEIRAALDGALFEPAELVALLLPALGEREGQVRRLLRWPLPFLATPLRRLVERVADAVRAEVRRLITEHLMTLQLGADVVRLGRDLVAPPPADLRDPANPELLALLARVDPDPRSGAGSGAEDWADFGQRMHFIAELFRGRQADPGLLSPPP